MTEFIENIKIAERNHRVLTKQGEMRRRFKKFDAIAYALYMAEGARQMYPDRTIEINARTQRFMSKYYKKQGFLRTPGK